jgi:hypothetical protein
MATDLFTPILNDRTRAPHFFNGRLLTGEAMSAEQKAQQVAHELLAKGLGDGVAWGLEVLVSTALNTVDAPVVTVTAGTAISRRGDLLFLKEDTDLQLVRPTTASAATQKIFNACVPPQQGTYVTDAGVYLLTIAPITVGDQLAPVSGLGGSGSCNVKYRVNAVEFRLIALPVSDDVLSDTARMRNRVAYACFGIDDVPDFAVDPVGESDEVATLLDAVESTHLTDCDVPLAVMYWSATTGIQFIDMWAVRRRLTRSRSAAAFPPYSDGRLARTEAMVLQFHDHIRALRHSVGSPSPVAARAYFRFLPPVGVIPIARPANTGVSESLFFTNLTTSTPAFVEGARLQTVVEEALRYFPIDTRTAELIWLYRIRENRQALDRGELGISAPALVFVSGHVPFRGDAHFDVAKWDYATFS